MMAGVLLSEQYWIWVHSEARGRKGNRCALNDRSCTAGLAFNRWFSWVFRPLITRKWVLRAIPPPHRFEWPRNEARLSLPVYGYGQLHIRSSGMLQAPAISASTSTSTSTNKSPTKSFGQSPALPSLHRHLRSSDVHPVTARQRHTRLD
jgi:hypothetical protein